MGGKKGEREKEREREEQRRREGETGKERRRQREKTERGILLESVGIHVYLFQMIQETETLMDDQYHSSPTPSSLLLKSILKTLISQEAHQKIHSQLQINFEILSNAIRLYNLHSYSAHKSFILAVQCYMGLMHIQSNLMLL